jgi:hypothetical protein
MTRVQLPAVRRLESVDPDLLPTTSQLPNLASLTTLILLHMLLSCETLQ